MTRNAAAPLTESSDFSANMKIWLLGKHLAMSMLQIVLLTAVLAPFLLASWAAFLHWDQSSRAVEAVLAEPGPTPDMFRAESLDLPDLLREIADALAPLARARFTRIGLAVSPGRTVWAERHGLSKALGEVITTAICASSGGQVLISVLPLGSEVNIVVTDDAACADQHMRETMARGAGDLIAMQGGRLAVEARVGHGASVTIRLPLPAAAMAAAPMETAIETAVAARIMSETVG